MNNNQKVSLAQFIDYFPVLPLPVTLSENTHHDFSKQNEPFPAAVIREYLLPLEGLEKMDDLLEFVPCFRIPDTKNFEAIVYWKAELLNYNYVLVTFLKDGTFIDKRVIAGTTIINQTITRSVATIDSDWSIYIMSGEADTDNALYDASKSKAIELELMFDGTIEGGE